MKVKSAIWTKWGGLVLDPTDEQYLDQPVSLPVPECLAASRVRDNIWWFPIDFVSGRADYLRYIDFDVPCGKGRLIDPRYAPLLQFCKSFALTRMAKPLQGWLSLGTVKRHLSVAFAICDAIAQTSWKKGRRKLADQTVKDLRDCIAIVARNWRPNAAGFECLEDVLILIRTWGEQGILRDWFKLIDASEIREICGCKEKNRPPHAAPSDRHLYTTPPLPVLYCAKSLEYADFYMNVMAEPLIERVGVLAQYRREETDMLVDEPNMTIWDPRRARVRFEKWALDNPWPFDELPFEVRYKFPPRTSGELIYPLVNTQAAAMHCVGLAVAPRSSEDMAMERDCVGPSRHIPGLGSLTTLRFKGARGSSYPVSWDVPAWVMKAIEVQLRLGEVLHAPAVWHCTQWSDWGKRLRTGMNHYLRNFAYQHHLDATLGNLTEPSIQRFRPTVAREIIMSPHGHIRLVQRILGHKSVKTTEAYIKMNPYLAPELAEARMRRIGAMPTEWSATDIQIRMLSGELSAEAMAEMILQADVRGEKLRLLAPGTLLADWECVPHAILHAFDCDAVRRETLGFAVKTLCHREVRALPSVHAWYVAEARRLSEAIESGVSFVPENAREAAVYGIVREGH